MTDQQLYEYLTSIRQNLESIKRKLKRAGDHMAEAHVESAIDAVSDHIANLEIENTP